MLCKRGKTYDQLFAMIWKRAISISDMVKRLYERKAQKQVSEVSGLGYIPDANEDNNRGMLSTLIGVKMGSGNKASTYNWFKNRLSDTQGTIVPRSMIDIFAKAADKEIQIRKSGYQMVGKSIIRPKCFEDMLPEVSEKRAIDAWLNRPYIDRSFHIISMELSPGSAIYVPDNERDRFCRCIVGLSEWFLLNFVLYRVFFKVFYKGASDRMSARNERYDNG